MASHNGIPSDADAKGGKADPDEEALNAKVKAELDAAFQAGEEIDLKLAVDEGGNPPVWFEIDGADVPVDKVGWNARASRSSLWTRRTVVAPHNKFWRCRVCVSPPPLHARDLLIVQPHASLQR